MVDKLPNPLSNSVNVPAHLGRQHIHGGAVMEEAQSGQHPWCQDVGWLLKFLIDLIPQLNNVPNVAAKHGAHLAIVEGRVQQCHGTKDTEVGFSCNGDFNNVNLCHIFCCWLCGLDESVFVRGVFDSSSS